MKKIFVGVLVGVAVPVLLLVSFFLLGSFLADTIFRPSPSSMTSLMVVKAPPANIDDSDFLSPNPNSPCFGHPRGLMFSWKGGNGSIVGSNLSVGATKQLYWLHVTETRPDGISFVVSGNGNPTERIFAIAEMGDDEWLVCQQGAPQPKK